MVGILNVYCSLPSKDASVYIISSDTHEGEIHTWCGSTQDIPKGEFTSVALKF